MAKRWHYIGDINLEEGGAFIREGDYPDYCDAVQVTPCSDAAGGPSNLFWIESGTVYLGNPDHVARALECCGDTESTTQWRKGYAVLRYMGMDRDHKDVIRIGKDESEYAQPGFDCDNVKPDIILRGNASLMRFVRREYL
jgi:hypothetical protein